MFFEARGFNQDLTNWDVSSVNNMSYLFFRSNFNGDISTWDVSSVTNMSGMFNESNNFNRSIGDWDVSSVTNMEVMFRGNTSFNQDIGNWDVSNVNNMVAMFAFNTIFNRNIGAWDVSSVNNMSSMFYGAEKFNQPIGNWNVSEVENMNNMFRSAVLFNQDISNWCVGKILTQPENFSTNSPLLVQYFPSWGTCPDSSNIVDPQLPIEFNLSQNYPNPFNPKTQIKYSIEELGPVTLTVYTLLGQKVITLVDRIHSTGNYEITLDATNLPSGVYIYRLVSENKNQTKKMILLK
jgi:surface protein